MVYLEQCCLMWVCTALLNGPCCCLFFLYGGFTLLLIPIFFLLTIPPLLIVGLMKVIPLCRRYTGTLFLFSVFLASLTEVIPVLRKFHFAAWISLILCTIIFFFFFAFVRGWKIWNFGQACLPCFCPPLPCFFLLEHVRCFCHFVLDEGGCTACPKRILSVCFFWKRENIFLFSRCFSLFSSSLFSGMLWSLEIKF